MKQLSLKAKLTLLYSVIMVVIFSITLGILFYFSSNEILTSTRSMLEERVSSSFDSVEYRNDRLEYDNDLLEIQDGVYLSVYDRDGQMLYGKIPYDFDASLPFEEGNVRRIDTDGVDFFVLDMSFPVENYGTLQMRGIVSITVAAVVFTGILGAILAPLFIKLFRIKDPVAAGLAIGACSHAVGTSKALELGEAEGAMSSIAIGVCGLMTVLFSLFLH